MLKKACLLQLVFHAAHHVFFSISRNELQVSDEYDKF